MWKETKTQKEVVETRKFCDVCETEIRVDLACSKAKCEYCGKDLCEKCIGHEDYADGDYRIVYCKRCWDLGGDYRPEIDELHQRIERLYTEWQDKCKTPATLEP